MRGTKSGKMEMPQCSYFTNVMLSFSKVKRTYSSEEWVLGDVGLNTLYLYNETWGVALKESEFVGNDT